MNRTGLVIALLVGAGVGLVLGIYPELDLALAAPFYDPQRLGFWVRVDPFWLTIRSLSSWVVGIIAAPAFIALAIKILRPRRPLLVPGRAILFLIATLALAPGIVANVILKDNWGRPRPIDVPLFEGTEPFVPWWDPRGVCPKNCSFVAGEPSGAFWTLAPAALAPPPWQAVAYGAALAYGAAIGLLRMAGGGHFFSDVVFSGVFTFLIIWTAHGLIYRWRRTRLTDDDVERAIERVVMPGHLALLRLMRRVRGQAARSGKT